MPGRVPRFLGNADVILFLLTTSALVADDDDAGGSCLGRGAIGEDLGADAPDVLRGSLDPALVGFLVQCQGGIQFPRWLWEIRQVWAGRCWGRTRFEDGG